MADAPRPFSTEWMTSEPTPPEPRRRMSSRLVRSFRALAVRLPGERALTVLVVVLLVIGSFAVAGPKGDAHNNPLDAQIAARTTETVVDDIAPEATAPPTAEVVDTGLDEETPGAEDDATETTAPSAPKLRLDQQEEAKTDGGLLPQYRLLTYYGFPGNPDMGILGEHGKEEVLEQMREVAAQYEEVDPDRPVKIAFEIIASVAQREPQGDGSYLLDTPSDVLDEYAQFAEENDILLFLDIQIGRRTVEQEIEGLRPWLERPNVHLAIDPEFAMRSGEIPGEHIGQIDGSDITFAQEWLVQFAEEAEIPPKVLIVHQFHHSMIENKDKVKPVKGVQLIIDADGWGSPEEKKSTYDFVNTQAPIEYNGIKLFYRQDVPLMTPEEVLKLDPIPDLIIYQ